MARRLESSSAKGPVPWLASTTAEAARAAAAACEAWLCCDSRVATRALNRVTSAEGAMGCAAAADATGVGGAAVAAAGSPCAGVSMVVFAAGFGPKILGPKSAIATPARTQSSIRMSMAQKVTPNSGFGR